MKTKASAEAPLCGINAGQEAKKEILEENIGACRRRKD